MDLPEFPHMRRFSYGLNNQSFAFRQGDLGRERYIQF